MPRECSQLLICSAACSGWRQGAISDTAQHISFNKLQHPRGQCLLLVQKEAATQARAAASGQAAFKAEVAAAQQLLRDSQHDVQRQVNDWHMSPLPYSIWGGGRNVRLQESRANLVSESCGHCGSCAAGQIREHCTGRLIVGSGLRLQHCGTTQLRVISAVRAAILDVHRQGSRYIHAEPPSHDRRRAAAQVHS
jgi:hypothetical protein